MTFSVTSFTRSLPALIEGTTFLNSSLTKEAPWAKPTRCGAIDNDGRMSTIICMDALESGCLVHFTMVELSLEPIKYALSWRVLIYALADEFPTRCTFWLLSLGSMSGDYLLASFLIKVVSSTSEPNGHGTGVVS